MQSWLRRSNRAKESNSYREIKRATEHWWNPHKVAIETLFWALKRLWLYQALSLIIRLSNSPLATTWNQLSPIYGRARSHKRHLTYAQGLPMSRLRCRLQSSLFHLNKGQMRIVSLQTKIWSKQTLAWMTVTTKRFKISWTSESCTCCQKQESLTFNCPSHSRIGSFHPALARSQTSPLAKGICARLLNCHRTIQTYKVWRKHRLSTKSLRKW